MPTLSVVIATLNEQDDIRACLESVAWADEIIVVDMFSTDQTVELCRAYTQNILQHNQDQVLNVNKNVGIAHAQGDWILELDADERVSPELKDEILKVLSDQRYSGYLIPFDNYWFGRLLKHGGQREWHLRLYRRGAARYPCQMVHEQIQIEGRVSRLTQRLLHYCQKNIAEQFAKTNLYTSQEARVLYQQGRRARVGDFFLAPLKTLLERYVLQQGFRDGRTGLVVVVLLALYSLMKQLKLYEYKWRQRRQRR